MKAIQLENPGQFVAVTAEPPGQPGPGEALVRVHRMGVCGTDIHAFGGRQPFFSYPRILGHELGVEVLAVGPDVSPLQVGDRAAVEPYLHCGGCIACRSGKPNCCVAMRVLGVHVDGGMREQFLLPAEKLHPSGALTFDQLALVEALAIGCHAVERAEVKPDEFVLVIGAGPIGLSVMQFVQEKGAQMIVMDVNEARLDFCCRQLGLSHSLIAGQENIPGVLAALTKGDLPAVVFDATGNPGSMAASFDFPAHGGRLVFVGLFQGDVTFHDPNFHRRELTLLASRNALSADFARIIRLIEAGRIDTAPWITHRAAFDDVIAQFPAWTQPETGVIKAMIEV